MDSFDFHSIINKQIESQIVKNVVEKMATVIDVNQDGVKIIVDGETKARDKYYKRFASYETPVVGDRVVAVKINNTFVIYSKVI